MNNLKNYNLNLPYIGLHSYMIKAAVEELSKTLHSSEGNAFLSEQVQKLWNEFITQKLTAVKANPQQLLLSRREIEIICLICQQMSCKIIAEKLFISESTVKNHRAHIMEKLKTDNVVGIAMYAVRTGLFIP